MMPLQSICGASTQGNYAYVGLENAANSRLSMPALPAKTMARIGKSSA
jgi:hypothetical protein